MPGVTYIVRYFGKVSINILAGKPVYRRARELDQLRTMSRVAPRHSACRSGYRRVRNTGRSARQFLFLPSIERGSIRILFEFLATILNKSRKINATATLNREKRVLGGTLRRPGDLLGPKRPPRGHKGGLKHQRSSALGVPC